MNILINPILHPLLQLFISILLILGTIQIDQISIAILQNLKIF